MAGSGSRLPASSMTFRARATKPPRAPPAFRVESGSVFAMKVKLQRARYRFLAAGPDRSGTVARRARRCRAVAEVEAAGGAAVGAK